MYLNCHSYFSLRYGTFSEKELLENARDLGISCLVLTDINNTSACLNFIRLAPQYGLRPLVGIDCRNGAQQEFVGIAQNNYGYQELNAFVSSRLHTKQPIPSRAPGFRNVFVIYPFSKVRNAEITDWKENEYIGISVEDLRFLRFSPLRHLSDRLVILQPVTFRHKRDFNVHRLLRAVDNNTLLSKLPKTEEACPEEVLLPPAALRTHFRDYPHIIRNTEALLDQCEIRFDFSPERVTQNQRFYTGSEVEDWRMIQALCEEGVRYRYGEADRPEIRARMEKELKLIGSMDYTSYFLISRDIVQYARNKGYFYVGRGSGANSIVAYLLGITDVDPIDLDLYFERFINLYRKNPPDFDIDFSWRDREDVTRYIFDRFNHVSLLATYNTFHHKGATRELGKVFGLPKHEIDRLSDPDTDLRKLDKLSIYVLKYSQLLYGMPNHLGIHAGGILIAEQPLNAFSVTNIPPKGFPTVQFDMVVAEDVGLYKYDILGQRGLAKVKEALEVIRVNRPDAPPIDIHDVDKLKADGKINGLIRDANCLGCFYVESPAMRMLLEKLRVDNYLGLVAASSIIRPGVAKSGMMREYILRHRDPERAKREAHPVMLGIMPDTYGVMVYQEDVIKVAHHFAGLDLGQADVLRRGMSGKFRSREEFEQVKIQFFENCRLRGYPEETISEIWRQTESFAGYAFAKGHSASYAVESYQTLFLKAYYPLEYMVAVLNNGGGFYRPEIYVHEAKLLGGRIHAPCVNHSEGRTVIYGENIYLGMGFLHGLDSRVIRSIEEDRNLRGAYSDLDDFIDRVPVGIEQISILVRIDAFRFTGENKRALLWKAHYKLGSSPKKYYQARLFHPQPRACDLPELFSTRLEDAFDQIELLGFPLCDPFLLLEKPPTNHILAKDISRYLHQNICIYGYLVTIKRTTTSGNDRMNFGTFLDQDGRFIDTTHFPRAAAAYPFRGKGIYRIYGRVEDEMGFLSINVFRLEKMAYIPDPRYADEVPEQEYVGRETG